MDVTVAVATFGADTWVTLAAQRAIPSAAALNVPVIHVHGDTLHEARNAGLRQVSTPWVCWLDADDELEAGYFDHVAAGSADIRVPAVRYVTPDRVGHARMPRVSGHPHGCTADCLPYGNWLVIGSVAPTELVRDVGGFRDFAWSEDWDLWVRCWQAGATIEACPDAVYRAHVRPDSRNRAPDPQSRRAAHHAIAAANGLPLP